MEKINQSPASLSDQFYFFGTSNAGNAARAVDWSKHPLGEPSKWPVGLKIILATLFNARQAMFLFWGKERFGFYNDCYIPILGPQKHPHVMGKTGLEIWPEAWETIVLPETIVAFEGRSTWMEDRLIPLIRDGKIYDGYYNYGYSPVYDETGIPQGALVTCFETTGKVVAEKSLKENEQRLEISLANIKNAEQNVVDVLESMHDGFISLDNDFRVLRVNRNQERISGLDRSQTVGKNHWDIWPRSTIPKIWDAYHKVISDHVPVRIEDYNSALKIWIAVDAFPTPENGIAVFFRDITEQKQATEILEDSEAQFRSLANSIPQLVWMAKPDGHIFWYNNKWYDYTGTTPAEMTGWDWQSIHDPDVLAKVVERWNHSISSGTSFEMIFPLRSKTGEFRSHLTRVNPVRDGNRKILGWFGTNTDIEDATSAQREIEDILESMTDAFFAIDKNWNVTRINARQETVTQLKREDQIGRNLIDLFFSGQGYEDSVYLKSYRKAMTERIEVRFEDFYEALNLWTEVRVYPKSDGGLAVFFTDITQSKATEVALRKSEQNFRVLFESAPGNYLILRPNLTIAAVSDAYTVATMTKRDQILEKYIFDVFPDNPDDPFATGVSNISASFNFVLSTKQSHTMALQKYEVRGLDGKFEEKWWSPINYPVIGSNGEVAYIIHRAEEVTDFVLKQKKSGQEISVPDSSSRTAADLFQRAHEIQDVNFRLQQTMEALVRSQEDLTRAKEEAEKANQLKSAFLANMSHEIRTPLGVMMGFSDLISDPEISSVEKKQYAQTIKRNGEQLSLLINDILDLSKVEAGHLKVEIIDFSLRTVIEEVLSVMNVKAMEKGLRLSLKIDTSIMDQITSDPTRLRQILFNMLSNAVKFTAKGEITLSAVHNDGMLELEVQDTGIGIAKESQTELFKPFHQADESITRKFGGTGLGLALSKRLAKLLGGNLSLKESILGQGSTFKLIVKNQMSNPSRESVKKKKAEPAVADANQSLDGVSVLLVEDSPDNQHLISRILIKRGAKVEFADNGLVGVEKALQGHYDILLMDIQMPVLDGYSATQRLREAGYRIPIIALTAHAMSEVRKKCLDVGCTDHLPKPVNIGDLVSTVAKYTLRG